MEKTIFGRTGLSVTRSAFGALPIQRLNTEDAANLLRRAYDEGINFFDTARSYSDSEEKIGVGLADVRENIVIATKTPSKTPEDFWKDIKTSLEKMKTDYIDIYQFHNPAEVPLEDSPLYKCMLEAREKGMIRFIGVTCHHLPNARLALDSGLYDTIQYPLSILSTGAEMEFAKDCGKKNIGVIAMKALCGGLLTSAAPSMAYLREMKHVVPIWGFQADSELDEVLELEKNPPVLDAQMNQRIEKDRKELAGDFCRGCGYCMPCSINIRINWIARMPQLLRRSPYQQYYSPEWAADMKLASECTQCGICKTRCPYELDIPNRLKVALEDYKQFGLEKGYIVDFI